MNNTKSFSGRLEVQLVTNSTSVPTTADWFKVCGDGWTAAETATACGQMGFHPGYNTLNFDQKST